MVRGLTGWSARPFPRSFSGTTTDCRGATIDSKSCEGTFEASACYRACGYAGRDEPRLERCREVLRPPRVRLASQGVRNGICARGQESPRLGVTQGRRAIQSEARPSAAGSNRGLFSLLEGAGTGKTWGSCPRSPESGRRQRLGPLSVKSPAGHIHRPRCFFRRKAAQRAGPPVS
jgi:hypothetical protein